MAETGAFWSYVHTDDDADGGRIAQLARDVVAEYQMLTGDSIHLFLDRDNIDWGDEWKLKIDSTLESVAFFIAVLTPRYFRNVEFRRELNFFARRADKVGINDLILPILYVDFSAFYEDPCQDDAIKLAKSFQWKDWTELRFEAADSPKYRRAVSDLARRLAAASALAEMVETTEAKLEEIQDDEDTALGLIDQLARMEDAMPKLTSTMEGVVAEVLNIGEIMRIIQNSFSEPRGRFNTSLITARRVARATALPDGINRVPIPTSIPSRKDRCDTIVLQVWHCPRCRSLFGALTRRCPSPGTRKSVDGNRADCIKR
jgi:hypothetical protein